MQVKPDSHNVPIFRLNKTQITLNVIRGRSVCVCVCVWGGGGGPKVSRIPYLMWW